MDISKLESLQGATNLTKGQIEKIQRLHEAIVYFEKEHANGNQVEAYEKLIWETVSIIRAGEHALHTGIIKDVIQHTVNDIHKKG